jgi:hypothetical protein
MDGHGTRSLSSFLVIFSLPSELQLLFRAREPCSNGLLMLHVLIKKRIKISNRSFLCWMGSAGRRRRRSLVLTSSTVRVITRTVLKLKQISGAWRTQSCCSSRAKHHAMLFFLVSSFTFWGDSLATLEYDFYFCPLLAVLQYCTATVPATLNRKRGGVWSFESSANRKLPF